MDVVLTQLFNGLSLGSILLLVALGLAITFGLMNVINMAHGEFLMVGAYVTFVIQRVFSQGTPFLSDGFFLVALPASFVVAATLGWFLEKTVIYRFYGRPYDSLLATWGISLILQQLARDLFGAPNVAVRPPNWLNGSLHLGDLVLPYTRLFILAVAVLSTVILYLFLYRTQTGLRIRAVMQNRPMAACLGISIKRIDAFMFAVGTGLAGIAGSIMTLLGPIGPSIGTYYIVDAFLVVVLGGVGKLRGTVLAAMVIGFLNAFLEFGLSATVAKAVVLLLIVVFLQWRPAGLVTVRTRALD